MKLQLQRRLSVLKSVSILCVMVAAHLLTGCNKPPKNMFRNGGNIGDVLLPGALIFDPNTNIYRLSGSGTNMWGTSDEFFMVWKEVKGDFTISAKVAFEGEGVDPHRKMGLIIRKTLESNAVYADVAVHGDGLTSLQYRAERGAETQEVVSENVAPGYITLQRKGSRITMKTGMEGFSDEIDGGITLDLPEKCYVGLFVCAHNPGVMETAYFSEVTLK